jgi:nucleoside-diphosphate-sugar epimerase
LAGRRCAATLFFDYQLQHNLEIKVACIFNTYGPYMHPNDGRVVANFVMQALRGEPIPSPGCARPSRGWSSGRYRRPILGGAARISPGRVNCWAGRPTICLAAGLPPTIEYFKSFV